MWASVHAPPPPVEGAPGWCLGIRRGGGKIWSLHALLCFVHTRKHNMSSDGQFQWTPWDNTTS